MVIVNRFLHPNHDRKETRGEHRNLYIKPQETKIN